MPVKNSTKRRLRALHQCSQRARLTGGAESSTGLPQGRAAGHIERVYEVHSPGQLSRCLKLETPINGKAYYYIDAWQIFNC